MIVPGWRSLLASALLSAAVLAVSVTGRPAWAMSLRVAVPALAAALVLALRGAGLLSPRQGWHTGPRRKLTWDEDETPTAVMAAPVAPLFPVWTPGIGRTPGNGHPPAVPHGLPSLWPHAAVVTVTDDPAGKHAQPRTYPVTPVQPLHPAIAASLAERGYTPHATAEDLLNSVYTKADAAMVRAITS